MHNVQNTTTFKPVYTYSNITNIPYVHVYYYVRFVFVLYVIISSPYM